MAYSIIRAYVQPLPDTPFTHTVDLPVGWSRDDSFPVQPDEQTPIIQRWPMRLVYRGPACDEDEASFKIFQSLKYACMNRGIIKEWSFNKVMRTDVV